MQEIEFCWRPGAANTSVTWSNVYSGAVFEFSRGCAGQVRRRPCPQVCPNLFLLLWPGYKVAGDQIFTSIFLSPWQNIPPLNRCPKIRIVLNSQPFPEETHVGRLLSEIRRSNEMSDTKHFMTSNWWGAITRYFQVSECPVSWSVGHCVALWDSRSHLPGGQFSRVSRNHWRWPSDTRIYHHLQISRI